MTETDLRWLVCQGLVRHSREITKPDDQRRQFQPEQNLSFPNGTCFVLTELGASTVWLRLKGQFKLPLLPPPTFPAVAENGLAQKPCLAWDCERHELWVDGHLVKHFKWPAVNQETILAAFQEERWPPRIDDPLPPHPGQVSKRRLHDTIKCLNRNQKNRLLHFRGDGTGEGVLWDLVGPQ